MTDRTSGSIPGQPMGPIAGRLCNEGLGAGHLGKDNSSYERAASPDLMALLAEGGFLAPLTGLKDRKVAGLNLDVHLVIGTQVHVYCGLTRLMNVRRYKSGTVRVSAHRTFSRQACARELLRTWKVSELEGFKKALDTYLQ